MKALFRDPLPKQVETDFIAADDTLLAQHTRYFSTVLADTSELQEAAHALRFQVYCLERNFENADEHPDGLEIDGYDAHAVQGVLFHRPTHSPMGAVRVILTRGDAAGDLPIEKLLEASSLSLSDHVNLSQTIEISRFAISKKFRSRQSDQTPGAKGAASLREANLAFLSLLQFVLRESVKHHVLYWTAVMEPKFLRLLARMGITYTPLGPLVLHHGIRQPCYCYLPEMLENARRAQLQCWEVLTDGGKLHKRLVENMQGSSSR